ncbi:hypothetical protein BKA57DRAFT_247941 [Linnemannia elongata]|nr:hypothetical protein BKA57DRAFT_247941 [Linnemannia elongata]
MGMSIQSTSHPLNKVLFSSFIQEYLLTCSTTHLDKHKKITDIISDILGAIGDFLGVIWTILVGIWDLIVNVWNLPGVIWDQLSIFWANLIDFWDQIPWDQVGCVSKYGLIGACYGALGIPFALGIIPRALGFSAGGIIAGSIASMMMAFYAGFTPAGGFVAIMQSIGAVGLFAGFNPYVMIAACVVGLVGGACVALFYDGFCDVPLY